MAFENVDPLAKALHFVKKSRELSRDFISIIAAQKPSAGNACLALGMGLSTVLHAVKILQGEKQAADLLAMVFASIIAECELPVAITITDRKEEWQERVKQAADALEASLKAKADRS